MASTENSRVKIARIGPIEDTNGRVLHVYVPLTANLTPDSVVFENDEIEGIRQVVASLSDERVQLVPELTKAAEAFGYPLAIPSPRDAELIAEVAMGLRDIEGLPATPSPKARRQLFHAMGSFLDSAVCDEIKSGSMIDAEISGTLGRLGPFHATATLGYRHTLEPGLTFALQDLASGPADVLIVAFRESPVYAARALKAAFGLPGVPHFTLLEGRLSEEWSATWLPSLSALLAVTARLSAAKSRIAADTEIADGGALSVEARLID